METEQITGGISALHDTVFGGRASGMNETHICVRHDMSRVVLEISVSGESGTPPGAPFPSIFVFLVVLVFVLDTYWNISIYLEGSL